MQNYYFLQCNMQFSFKVTTMIQGLISLVVINSVKIYFKLISECNISHLKCCLCNSCIFPVEPNRREEGVYCRHDKQAIWDAVDAIEAKIIRSICG